eukprot:gene3243-2225_t
MTLFSMRNILRGMGLVYVYCQSTTVIALRIYCLLVITYGLIVTCVGRLRYFIGCKACGYNALWLLCMCGGLYITRLYGSLGGMLQTVHFGFVELSGKSRFTLLGWLRDFVVCFVRLPIILVAMLIFVG